MKKLLCLILCFMQAIVAGFAQTGINTKTPKASLDVQKSTNPAFTDGIIPPRVTCTELLNKPYSAEQKGALVYVTDADCDVLDSDLSDTASPKWRIRKITKPSYYSFNGTEWIQIALDNISTKLIESDYYNRVRLQSGEKTTFVNKYNYPLDFLAGEHPKGFNSFPKKPLVIGESNDLVSCSLFYNAFIHTINEDDSSILKMFSLSFIFNKNLNIDVLDTNGYVSPTYSDFIPLPDDSMLYITNGFLLHNKIGVEDYTTTRECYVNIKDFSGVVKELYKITLNLYLDHKYKMYDASKENFDFDMILTIERLL